VECLGTDLLHRTLVFCNQCRAAGIHLWKLTKAPKICAIVRHWFTLQVFIALTSSAERRRRAESDLISAPKCQRQSERSFDKCADSDTSTDGRARSLLTDQLPSPALTRSGHETKQEPINPSAGFASFIGKRKAKLDERYCPPPK
jgi:hypothetical protein